MDRKEIERVELAVPDVAGDRIELLKALFPDAVSEGRVCLNKLLDAIGEETDVGAERYSFSWAGKRDSIRLLQTPTRATLVPDVGESVAFAETGNAFIEGDNLEVLKLLYKSYFGRVKMIYIDPPYNTGNDFVYPDNYADPLDSYLRLTGQKDAEGNLLTSNAETSGRYHSAWLSMIYPRLFLARQLLREDGVIFVSIDDHEVHNLRMVMNEIFGEENFIGVFVWQSKKGGGSDKADVVNDQEYLVCYVRTDRVHALARETLESEDLDKTDKKGSYRRGRELNKWGSNSRREDRPTMYFPITGPDGEEVYPIRNDGAEGCWRWGKKKMLDIVQRGDVEFVKRSNSTCVVYEKIRTTDPRFKPYRTWLSDVGTTADGSKEVKQLFDGQKIFDFPKPVSLLKHLVSIGTTCADDVVLDFFAGSGTTAQAVIERNREEGSNLRFICVQFQESTPEASEARKYGYDNISEIGKERIRRVIGRLAGEKAGRLDLSGDSPEDLGFRVFKLSESKACPWAGVGEFDPETYIRQMELYADPLAEGWKPEELAWEIALKEGYGLSSRIESVSGDGNAVYRVTDPERGQSFLLCLDDSVEAGIAKTLGLGREDTFICRDAALTDDLAANLALQCRLKTV